MKKIITLLFLVSSLVPNIALSAGNSNVPQVVNSEEAGDSEDFLDALYGDWREDVSDQEKIDRTLKKTKVELGSHNVTTKLPKSCTREDQKSLSLKAVRGLLLSKSQKIAHYHDPETGDYTIDGGQMIGNCNSMLQFVRASSGDTHKIELEIIKPEGCSTKKCAYEVLTANGGIANTKPMPITVEPNYYGFIECLRKTGVYSYDKTRKKPLKINLKKVVRNELKYTRPNVRRTGEMRWVSHGPEASVRGGAFEIPKKIKDNGCYYSEKISKNGSQVYSSYDTKQNYLKKEMKRLGCEDGKSWQAIEQALPNFKQFAWMQSFLKDVRNELLLKDVRKIHKDLAEKDYSNLDATAMKETMVAFKNKIIDPLKQEIANLYNKLKKSSNKIKKKNLQKKINIKVKKLRGYASGKYFTKSDYIKMKSFKKGSQLANEDWRTAALNGYYVNNSAHHYSRYSSKHKKNLKLLSPKEVKGLIVVDVAKEESHIRMRGELAANPKKSFAREHAKSAQKITEKQRKADVALKTYVNKTTAHMQNHCMNPGKYWVNRNSCIRRAQADVNSAYDGVNYYKKSLKKDYDLYATQANYWAGIEKLRNTAYGIKASPLGRQARGDFSFKFDPVAPTNSNQRRNINMRDDPQYQLDQYRRPALYNQQQYSGNQWDLNTSYRNNVDRRYMTGHNYQNRRGPANFDSTLRYETSGNYMFTPGAQFNANYRY